MENAKKKRLPTSYSISDETKLLLIKIAEHHKRSKANMIESLIYEEAKRLGIIAP